MSDSIDVDVPFLLCVVTKLSCNLSDIFLLHIFYGRCEMYTPYIFYMFLATF